MWKFVVKRLLLSVVILFFVALILYTVMRCIPTSFVDSMARQLSMRLAPRALMTGKHS